ncbi:tellurite resistance TerB family protein [Sphingobacterium sp. UT-1RO-CII-1]|uniref:tellurite resistance TerB family protein n=1 Tax=Sphingobacterium sp. UT-1RO-CII-1 TaxID=2995225 RepID=UPI00227C83BC|nr:tellurite resistance TerB family protein [Sphingobacterium sp. UT-1RO-CII-1]MCY4781469.1 tellurite resistance TerB family protein [Sphingobacterium sp. UT-1RO-CII-1]
MGLFNKFFGGDSSGSNNVFVPRNEQEAWVGIFVACAMSDGSISEMEQDMLNRFMVFKSWFDTTHTDLVMQPYRRAYHSVELSGGNSVIDTCVAFITEDRRDTLFCFIVEVLMSDGILDDTEKNVIEYLQKSLGISDELAVKIIDVYFIRSKGDLILY